MRKLLRIAIALATFSVAHATAAKQMPHPLPYYPLTAARPPGLPDWEWDAVHFSVAIFMASRCGISVSAAGDVDAGARTLAEAYGPSVTPPVARAILVFGLKNMAEHPGSGDTAIYCVNAALVYRWFRQWTATQ